MNGQLQGSNEPIRTLFLDIGGVLLTNSWDQDIRRRAAEKYNLDYEEMNERHHLTFDTFEEGKLSLDEYLERVIFYRERQFSRKEFTDFIHSQSLPFTEMIELIRSLKSQHGLQVAAVSNEGREFNLYRAKKYKLGSVIDFFITSCYVHYRKPDRDIYQMALDIAQVQPEQVIYIDDRSMFIEVAAKMGIRGIVHSQYETTRAALEELGLSLVKAT
jgi:putative hydrolase of the HAD superfamily